MLIHKYALNAVELTDPVLANAVRKEREYLRSIKVDRLLAGFRETAGLPAKAERYKGGWEDSEIAGHTLGHYMTAQAQLFDATRDSDARNRLMNLLLGLSECQAENGYLFAAKEEIFDRVEKGERAWVPWYTMHKLIAGLLSVYRYAKLPQALNIVGRLGEWVYNRAKSWDEDTRRRVLSVEYGGMNDCLYELYKETKLEQFKEAAEIFDETELFDDILSGKEVLAGKHANTTIPKFVGAVNRYICVGESEVKYLDAAKKFFDVVVQDHTYVTGGNSENEFFQKPRTLGAKRSNCNCETCNTYNMLKLSERLYRLTGEKKYMDYYEQAYFNAILGSQNPDTGMTTYFQPMAAGYFKTFSKAVDNFWCCTGTGMENFTKLNNNIYHLKDGEIFVNMYVGSVLHELSLNVEITQKTSFDSFDGTEFLVITMKPLHLAMNFRIPSWTMGRIGVRVNGEQAEYQTKDGYIRIERDWKAGDKVFLRFYPDIEVKRLPDQPKGAAFVYGPFVLAADLGTAEMKTETTGVNVTIPTKTVPVRDTIIINEGTVDDWFLRCRDNLVKGDGLSFTLNGTDADEELVFTPYYRHYKERYGIYFDFVSKDNLSAAELLDIEKKNGTRELNMEKEKQKKKEKKKEKKGFSLFRGLDDIDFDDDDEDDEEVPETTSKSLTKSNMSAPRPLQRPVQGVTKEDKQKKDVNQTLSSTVSSTQMSAPRPIQRPLQKPIPERNDEEENRSGQNTATAAPRPIQKPIENNNGNVNNNNNNSNNNNNNNNNNSNNSANGNNRNNGTAQKNDSDFPQSVSRTLTEANMSAPRPIQKPIPKQRNGEEDEDDVPQSIASTGVGAATSSMRPIQKPIPEVGKDEPEDIPQTIASTISRTLKSALRPLQRPIQKPIPEPRKEEADEVPQSITSTVSKTLMSSPRPVQRPIQAVTRNEDLDESPEEIKAREERIRAAEEARIKQQAEEKAKKEAEEKARKEAEEREALLAKLKLDEEDQKKVKEELTAKYTDLVKDEVNAEVRKKLEDEFRSELRDEVRYEVRHDLKNELRTEVKEEVKDALAKEFRESMKDEIGENVKKSLAEELRPALTDEVKQTLRTELHESLTPEVSEEVKKVLAEELRPNLTPEVSEDVKKVLRTELHESLTPEVSEEVKKVLAEELRPTLTPGVSEEVKKILHEELHESLKPEVTEDVKVKLAEELRPELKDGVAQEVRKNLTAELTDSLKDEVTGEVRKKLADELHTSLTPEISTEVKNVLRNELRAPLTLEVGDALRKELRDSMKNSVSDEVRKSLKNELHDSLKNEVSDNLRKELHESLKPSVTDEVRAGLRTELHDDIALEVMDALRNELHDEMKDEVSDDLRKEFRVSLKDDVTKEIRNELHDQLKDEVSKDLRNELHDDMKDEIGDELRREFRETLKDDVTQEIRNELHDSLHDDVDRELREEFRENMHDDVEKQIRDELYNSMVDKVSADLRSELYDGLKDEVSDALRKEIREQKADEIQEQIKNEIKAETKDAVAQAIMIEEMANARINREREEARKEEARKKQEAEEAKLAEERKQRGEAGIVAGSGSASTAKAPEKTKKKDNLTEKERQKLNKELVKKYDGQTSKGKKAIIVLVILALLGGAGFIFRDQLKEGVKKLNSVLNPDDTAKNAIVKDIRSFVASATVPSGFTVSEAEKGGKKCICIEGNGVKTYYSTVIPEDGKKEVIMEDAADPSKSDKFYWDYELSEGMTDLSGLCPELLFSKSENKPLYLLNGNADNYRDYIIVESEDDALKQVNIPDAGKVLNDMISKASCSEENGKAALSISADGKVYNYLLDINGTYKDEAYNPAIQANEKVSKADDGFAYESYVKSNGVFVGKVVGEMDLVYGSYIPTNLKYYALTDADHSTAPYSGLFENDAKAAETVKTGSNGENVLIK